MIRTKMSLRRRIYLFFLIAGAIYILFPCVVHADIFGYEVQDLYVDITENVAETNELLGKAYEISRISPYDIFGELEKQNKLAANIHEASQTVALVVATLLLMVDFFRKSITFEWSSKWENILLFLIKIIVIKQVVQNVDVIVGHVYALFDYINTKAKGASTTTVEFLPYGTPKEYKYFAVSDWLKQAASPWWTVIKDIAGSKPSPDKYYIISEKAVKMFYPNAEIPPVPDSSIQWGNLEFENPTNRMVFNGTLEKIFIYPYFLFIKLIAYFIFVIVIGRTFELCVYTLLAPLPLCTFASEISHDTAKNFLRNYIAVILQMTIIATMFAVYVCMNNYFVTNADAILKGTKLVQILILASLALGVQKSGEWSRRLCGAV